MNTRPLRRPDHTQFQGRRIRIDSYIAQRCSSILPTRCSRHVAAKVRHLAAESRGVCARRRAHHPALHSPIMLAQPRALAVIRCYPAPSSIRITARAPSLRSSKRHRKDPYFSSENHVRLTLNSHAIDSESGVRLVKALRFPQNSHAIAVNRM